jgi:putative DNA primase/helicase
LIARTVALIPVIRRSITVCSRVAAAHFDSQALGDQYGTLLAGAWSLQASRVPSAAEVQSLIDGADWSSYRESTEIPDERRCLNRILQHQLRVESEERSVVTRTVLELVELVSSAMPSPMEPVRPADAADLLARHGLRVREGELLISNSAEAIGRMLADTAWVTNWGAILSRLPGASRSLLVHFRGLGSSRAVALPGDTTRHSPYALGRPRGLQSSVLPPSAPSLVFPLRVCRPFRHCQPRHPGRVAGAPA